MAVPVDMVEFTDIETAVSEPSTTTNISQINTAKEEPINTTYPIHDLITNQYIYSRIIMILLTIFITIVSIFYAIAEGLSLTLDNYLCDSKTLKEVRQNSIKEKLPKGDAASCWATK